MWFAMLGSWSLAATPTDAEQLLLYALNRARHDPAAYAVARGLGERVGGDGQLATFTDIAPRPPLACNSHLVDSARAHADEMAAYDYFGHQSEVDGRWPNHAVRSAGYPLPDEVPAPGGLVWKLPDDTNQVESIAAGFADPLEALDALLLDEGMDPPMHRVHLLGIDDFFATHREIGVGFATSTSASYTDYRALHTGLEDVADRFLTGVVYDDYDGDGWYDAGEGLGGVEVTVDGKMVRTAPGGGWAVRVTDGTHAVSCEGEAFLWDVTQGEVSVAGESREVDCVVGFDGLSVDFEPPHLTAPVVGCESAGGASRPMPFGLALLLLGLRRRWTA